MRDSYMSPSLVDISLTNRCNLNCDFCYASSSPFEKSEHELSLDDYRKIFKDLADMKVLRISLSGGEPFIRNDFFEILNEAQKYDYAIVINSNGTLITEEIAKKLTEYNFDRICISLDGSNSNKHDIVRGNNSFIQTIEGIRLLQKYNLPVSTLFTLHKSNVDDLLDTIKLNENLGMHHMTIMVVCPTGRDSKGDTLVSKQQWYPMLLKISEMKKNNEIKLNLKIVPPNESPVFWMIYFPLKHYDRLDLLQVWDQDLNVDSEKREVSCQAGLRACSINYNGDVYGCDLMMGIEDFKAGNVKEESISNIWNNSETFIRLRKITFNEINGPCKDCDFMWCGAGCRSSAYNLTGDIAGSDMSCFYIKK